MWIHGYNPDTGEFIDLFAAPSPELVEAMETAGRVVVGSETYATPETHNYLGGALTPKLEVSLVPDKDEILADGMDQAVIGVSVEGDEPPESIELLVGDQSEVVALSGGSGSLSPVSALTPCAVLVQLADAVAFRAQPVIIEAVRHE